MVIIKHGTHTITFLTNHNPCAPHCGPHALMRPIAIHALPIAVIKCSTGWVRPREKALSKHLLNPHMAFPGPPGPPVALVVSFLSYDLRIAVALKIVPTSGMASHPSVYCRRGMANRPVLFKCDCQKR